MKYIKVLLNDLKWLCIIGLSFAIMGAMMYYVFLHPILADWALGVLLVGILLGCWIGHITERVKEQELNSIKIKIDNQNTLLRMADSG